MGPLMKHDQRACPEACEAACDNFESPATNNCAKECHACEQTRRAMVRARGGASRQAGLNRSATCLCGHAFRLAR